MKLVFIILASAFEFCLTFSTGTVSRFSTFDKRDKASVTTSKKIHERTNHEPSPFGLTTTTARKKLRTGTRSFEDEEKMRKSFNEMGRKGGLATSEAYLRKANGNPRIAKKLRSNAVKDGMKVRQEKYSQQTGKERYESSNNAFLARFQASEMKAKEKGLSPRVLKSEIVIT